MADKVEVEVTGRSKYEVAHQIALNILGAEHGGVTTAVKSKGRKEYLNTVVDAIDALNGHRQK